MRTIKFTIPGRLPGKQRAGRRHIGGKTIHSYNPHTTASAEGIVRYVASQAMTTHGIEMMTGALRVSIKVVRQPPKSWSKKKYFAAKYITGKPDVDNSQKLIFDALNFVVYRDDSQISEVNFARHYEPTGHERTEIVIEELVAA